MRECHVYAEALVSVGELCPRGRMFADRGGHVAYRAVCGQ